MANTVRSVWEIQVILNALGAKLPVTKTFDPVTQAVWEVLSKSLKLDPRFTKVSATDVSVDKNTYDVVVDEYAKRKAPKPQPVSGDDYIRLNNAIVAMGRVDLGSQRDQLGFTNSVKFKKFADGWTSVFESPTKRSLMMAVPPVWAQFLTTNWMTYRDIYNAAPLKSRTKMPHPAALEPGGIVQAFKDLWTPALAIASDSAKQVLQQAGVEFSKGASEESDKFVFSWGWTLAGVGLLGGLMYYAMRKSPSSSY